MIEINKIERAEALRYLGYGRNKPDEATAALLDICEKRLIGAITPRYIYAVFEKESCPVPLLGNDIVKHLAGCERVVLIAATLGVDTDRLISKTEVVSMAEAVILDAMASTAIEQLCRAVDREIAARYPDSFQTWRFSAGYGDFPLETQRALIDALSAEKRIGLMLSDSYLLTPRKSVTALMGLSDSEIDKGRRGCAVCKNMENCNFRINGEHCGF